jgi:hypothetical protein
MSDRSPVSQDYLHEVGAYRLAHRIEQYWREEGYPGIAVWAVPSHNAEKSYFIVRSNMRCGLPPGPRRPRAQVPA